VSTILLRTLIAAVTITTLASLLYLCGAGLDFTDEGFYLNTISQPWSQTYSHLQFGWVYHPLYVALNGSVAALRQANLLLIWLLATIMFVLLFAKFHQPINRIATLVLSAALATSALVLLKFWLPTPNYNSLAISALLLTACGVVASDSKRPAARYVSASAVGVGGWLCFMAKMSSAAALALVVAAYLAFTVRPLIRLLAIATIVAIAGLLLSAIAIDGSITQFVKRNQGGIELLQALSNDHDFKHLIRVDKISFDATVAGSLAAAPALLGTVILLFARGSSTLPRNAIGIAAYLALMPFVYAMGTANNIWTVASMAPVFWVAVALPLTSQAKMSREFSYSVIAIATVLVSAALIYDSALAPYRQSISILRQTTPVTIGSSIRPSSLNVSREAATHINSMRDGARRAGFVDDTPILDMTGEYPTTIFAVGGVSPGTAWLVDGYPNAEKYDDAALSTVSCSDIARAWILMSGSKPTGSYPRLLTSRGIDLAEYVNVARAPIINLRTGDRIEEHILLKPPENQSLPGCPSTTQNLTQWKSD
jgi:hypothetical protein